MRLSVFLLILAICKVSATNTYAQDARVNLDMRNSTLKDVLKEIESKSEFTFFYNDNSIDMSQKVNIKAENQKISDILDRILVNCTYSLYDKMVILKPLNAKDGQVPPRISGVVLDENGESVIGAAVKTKNTGLGTVTDQDGRFSMQVPLGETLVISYVGYEKKEVTVQSEKSLTIMLAEDTKSLQEIVVVGYGVQKKINLTGSVAAVGSDVLEARPIANTTTGLQGTLPGVTITNSTSRPGDNTVSIRIRGIGTLNNSDPLILIDGLEGNMNTLNPDDIESVSALKDAASAAIYGSRAANGVILITTKKANREVKPTLNYTGYLATQTPTSRPEMLDAVQYLELLKEATGNVNKNWGYTNDDILAVQNGSNPNYRANTNWVDELYKDHAPQQAHNLSMAGGSKTVGYYMSYGYLSTEGLLVGNGYNSTRNNARLKVNTELLDRLTVEGNIGYNDIDNWTPSSSDSGDSGLFYHALRSSPLVPVHFTDGQWGYGGSSGNPVAIANDGGFINYKSNETTLNISGDLMIIPGLNAKVQYGTRITNVMRKQQNNIIQHFQPNTTNPLAYSSNTSYLTQRDVLQRYENLSAQADYDKKIGQHSFHILAGFSQESQVYERMDAKREKLISNDLHVLDAGTGTQTNTGNANHWAIRSGFGRINYDFAERYLVELNLRYDLSSRFQEDNRGGYFPSASVAWRISEESFMKFTRQWLDNLKFRASYGTLGNQYTNSLYPYMSTIEPSTSNMPIGVTTTSSMKQTVASNKKLTWESIEMTDVGIDFTLLNNRLSFTGDYYIKNTKDILLEVKLPDVLGVKEPYQNAGKVQNKGWEIAVSWRDKIGNVKYGVNGSFSDVINKVVSMGDTADDFSSDQVRAVGYPINAFWGYVADGLISFDDCDYNPGTNTYTPKSTLPITNEYRTKLGPGDIKYKDLDGSGDITKEGDRTYIGSPIPRYTFSFGGNAEWKGIDLQFFFQGVGKCDGYIKGLGRHAFTETANYPQKVHLDRWTFDNPNPNASYPRFTYDETFNQSSLSSFWLEDASYIRLKNLQVGYTLPSKWTKKIRMDKCRFYFSGENLWTLTDFFYAYDPEVPVSNGGYYPVVKTFSFGLSLTLK